MAEYHPFIAAKNKRCLFVSIQLLHNAFIAFHCRLAFTLAKLMVDIDTRPQMNCCRHLLLPPPLQATQSGHGPNLIQPFRQITKLRNCFKKSLAELLAGVCVSVG
jgi:hypothetical protein